jgi:hypothetical protein
MRALTSGAKKWTSAEAVEGADDDWTGDWPRKPSTSCAKRGCGGSGSGSSEFLRFSAKKKRSEVIDGCHDDSERNTELSLDSRHVLSSFRTQRQLKRFDR